MRNNYLGQVSAIASLASRMPPVIGSETGVAYARAIAAQAAKAAEKVGDATGRALSDITKTEAARMVGAARAALTVTNDARAAMNKARTTIAQDAEAVRTRLAALERPATDELPMVSEIRQHFHSLKTAEKIDLVAAAQAAGDTATIKAILQGPSYLSGLAPALIEKFRAEYHTALAPDDVAHLSRLDESFDIINSIDDSMADLVGQFNTPEAQALIQTAQAATE